MARTSPVSWRERCAPEARALADAARRLVGPGGALANALAPGSRGAVFGCPGGIVAAALREALEASVVAFVRDPADLAGAAEIAWRQRPGPVDVTTVHDFAVDPRRQPFDWLLLVDGPALLRDPRARAALLRCSLLNMRRGTRVLAVRAPAGGRGEFALTGSRSRWGAVARLAARTAAGALVPGARAAPGAAARRGGTGLWAYSAQDLDGIGARDVEAEAERRVREHHAPHGLLPLAEYRPMLEALIGGAAHVRAAPLADVAARDDPAVTRVAVRHDVDLDLPTAVAMSAVEREFPLRSTYFLLHSSPVYYGAFGPSGRCFRFADAARSYRAIEGNGQEIGLHMDPVGIALEHDADGVQAMREELRWLRDAGLHPNGVCGHNSAWEYGIDNLEVIAGCNGPGPARFELPRTGLRRWLLGARWIDLGGVDPREPGIGYAGDLIRVVGREPLAQPRASDYGPRVDSRPVYEYRYERLYSLGYGGRWSVIAADYDRPASDLGLADVRDGIRGLPRGSRVILNIHPVYLGARERTGAHP